MRILAKIFPTLIFLTVLALPLSGSEQPISGARLTGQLPEVEFSQLSQRDPNPLGEKALSLYPEQWKHGETEHFIYHFVSGYVVTPISVEAEFYYRSIAEELKREQAAAAANTKSHIYVFERPVDWQQFQSVARLDKWTGGIHSQGSLFLLRDASFKFSSNTLGHEIAHLVLHRFYPNGIPLWLDEGFAQYVSKGSQATFRRTRGYDARPQSRAIAPPDLIQLSTLVAMTQPPSENVITFYNESERLVRFLVSTDKQAFLVLLDALATHQPFESALLRVYAGKFSDVAAFEEKFRDYATKDFGSSLQDSR